MLKQEIIESIRRIFHVFGFDIVRFNNIQATLMKELKQHHINLIFDIGAFVGAYAEAMFRAGYTGRIVSFEPQAQLHERLIRLSKKYSGWIIHERCALGSQEQVSYLNIAGNLASSSLLPMLKKHIDALPTSRYIGKEEVPIKTIDSIVDQYFYPSQYLFMKIDTQGFEHEILTGAKNTLSILTGIQLELSLTPLYQGEVLYDEMIQMLSQNGFTLEDIIPGFRDLSTGRLLQADFLFFRE
jgi:FkbM family methyltransferase